MNYNKCIFVGRLTRDPEIREVNGTNVVSFTIASNRSFKKKDGERAEKTLFMDAELWGPAAQIISDRAAKGRVILVDGPLEQDNFQAKDGSKRTRYKLRIEYFQIENGKRHSASDTEGGEFAADDEEAFQ